MIRDPGLQPERTALARQRTLLSVVLGSLVLGLGQLRYGSPLIAISAALLAMVAATPGILRPRHGAAADSGSPRAHSPGRQLARTARVVVILALLSASASAVNLLT